MVNIYKHFATQFHQNLLRNLIFVVMQGNYGVFALEKPRKRKGAECDGKWCKSFKNLQFKSYLLFTSLYWSRKCSVNKYKKLLFVLFGTTNVNIAECALHIRALHNSSAFCNFNIIKNEELCICEPSIKLTYQIHVHTALYSFANRAAIPNARASLMTRP